MALFDRLIQIADKEDLTECATLLTMNVANCLDDKIEH